MKILISGFEPFLGEEVNPSRILALRMEKEFSEVESLILPVEFGKSFNVLKSCLEREPFDFLIMLGQAAGRSQVCMEKVALNWVQTRYADEKGNLPEMGALIEGAPLALMTSFPVDKICRRLIPEQLQLDISFSAGTFVCNDLYFRVLEHFAGLKSVFIHVPLIPEQISDQKPRPSLPLDNQVYILKKITEALISERPLVQ